MNYLSSPKRHSRLTFLNDTVSLASNEMECYRRQVVTDTSVLLFKALEYETGMMLLVLTVPTRPENQKGPIRSTKLTDRSKSGPNGNSGEGCLCD